MNNLESEQMIDVFKEFHVDKAQATVESDRITIIADINNNAVNSLASAFMEDKVFLGNCIRTLGQIIGRS